MSQITIFIFIIIIIIQQLQLIRLNKQVNILAAVCSKLRVLSEKQTQDLKSMLELIVNQRKIIDRFFRADDDISTE